MQALPQPRISAGSVRGTSYLSQALGDAKAQLFACEAWEGEQDREECNDAADRVAKEDLAHCHEHVTQCFR